MAKSTVARATCQCGDLELASGEEAEVDLRYVTAKLGDDVDGFETLYPSDSLRIMIVDRAPGERRVGASAHHPGALEEQTLTPHGGPYQYRLNRYFLPHQGASIWWKRTAAAHAGLRASDALPSAVRNALESAA